MVEAIAHGHEAAESIDRFLRGEDLAAGREKPDRTAGRKARPGWFPLRDRAKPPRLPVAERTGYAEIEQTLDEQAAVAEAKRCLACGLCSECMQCVAACTAGAIVHDMLPEEVTVQRRLHRAGPGLRALRSASAAASTATAWHANVVTSLEFERILSASGPFQGHVLRPSDRKEPKRVAWIQCVGSRDVQCGNDYCSGVCCMYAVKEAIMAVDHVPGLEATIFYNDIRAYGKGFEAYYEGAKKNYGVRFQRGIISAVKERQQTKNLVLELRRPRAASGHRRSSTWWCSASASARRPSTGPTGRDRWASSSTASASARPRRWRPTRTSQEGIFVAGTFAAPWTSRRR